MGFACPWHCGRCSSLLLLMRQRPVWGAAGLIRAREGLTLCIRVPLLLACLCRGVPLGHGRGMGPQSAWLTMVGSMLWVPVMLAGTALDGHAGAC